MALLVVSPEEAAHRALEGIAPHGRWSRYEAANCAGALKVFRGTSIQVVICQETLPDGDWKSVLAGAAQVHPPPELIVFSYRADERLWAEVLNLGAYDLLLWPFDKEEVRRVVSLAADWSRRRRTMHL